MYEIEKHISIDPEIRFGSPCIIGTRIAIGDILSWLASGMTENEILNDFPKLTHEHIKASIAFETKRNQ